MISSSSNERIKAARRLQRRRHRLLTGTLLIEGLRLVRDAWRRGSEVKLLFVAPDIVGDNQAAHALIQAIQSGGVEIVECTNTVFTKLTETVTPQGIAAIVPLPALQLPDQADLVLLLDRVRDPGNAGTLLRSAEAAGAQLAIFGPETVDPFNDKVMRAGMGAHFRLPIRVCETWSDVRDTLPPTLSLYLADANGTLTYDAVDWRQPAGLIVGGEAGGASQEAVTVATAIRIPMLGVTESLNVGVAGAIILFEAQRQRRASSPA